MDIATLWEHISRETQEAVEQEPALASFYHACILNHGSLCDALSYQLASQLGNEAVPAILLRETFDEALRESAVIVDSARADIEACRERDPACDRYYLPLLYFKGFHAIQAHRIAHWLWSQGRTAMAMYVQNRIAQVFDVDIHPAANIGKGILMDHATGVVIGETAVIGDNVSMLHGVTLGGCGRAKGDRHPKVSSGVLISAGAKILGNIAIGEGAKIGAGSLVLEPVLAHTTVAGVPAKRVGSPDTAQPALNMDHRIEL
ncbi:MAG: serine O-acetyltransferase [Cellvibrionaceae bacterium]